MRRPSLINILVFGSLANPRIEPARFARGLSANTLAPLCAQECVSEARASLRVFALLSAGRGA